MPNFLKPRAARGQPEMACIPCLHCLGFGVKKIAHVLRWKNHSSVWKVLKRNGMATAQPDKLIGRKRKVLNHTQEKSHECAMAKAWKVEWPRASRKDFWANHPEMVRAISLSKYYKEHERNKEKSRKAARHKWHSMSKDQRFAHYAKLEKKRRAAGILPKSEWDARRRNPFRLRRSVIKGAQTGLAKIIRQIKRGKETDTPRAECGCSSRFLKRWIESKFHPRQGWHNHGKTWQVDHIIPISSFNVAVIEERRKANHYTNLRPLTIKRNQDKSNKLPAGHQSELLLAW